MRDYIKRTLTIQTSDDKFGQSELMQRPEKYFVLLAEPGEGKTTLLKNLKDSLEGKCEYISAKMLMKRGLSRSPKILLIDAVDEWKQEQQDMEDFFAEISTIGAGCEKIMIASRGIEWGGDTNKQFAEWISTEPALLELVGFDASQQQQLYQQTSPRETWSSFQQKVSHSGLADVLENPQTLLLLAEVYQHSDVNFNDKQQIFKQALLHLPTEKNPADAYKGITKELKNTIAGEIFTKLLLASKEGVALSEATATDEYIDVAQFVLKAEPKQIEATLESRLFIKHQTDFYCYKHRMLAEYAAAEYLISLCKDVDKPMLFGQLLTVMVPSQQVRDDLQGVLAWMACLGDERIQQDLIPHVPSAIFDYAAPEKLFQKCKMQLLQQLEQACQQDPYLRFNNRLWSVREFLQDDDLVAYINRQLVRSKSLAYKKLLVELVISSQQAQRFKDGLQKLIEDPKEDQDLRRSALFCWQSSSPNDLKGIIEALSKEDSVLSLELRLSVFKSLKLFPQELYPQLQVTIQHCVPYFDASNDHNNPELFQSDLMVMKAQDLIVSLRQPFLKQILTDLGNGLRCQTDSNSYGMRRLIFRLLTQYLICTGNPPASMPEYAQQVWNWLQPLQDCSQQCEDDLTQYLQNNHSLRQEMIRVAVTDLKDVAQIHRAFIFFDFNLRLELPEMDYDFMATLAAETKHFSLWEFAIRSHSIIGCSQNADSAKHWVAHLRKKMRAQALQDPSLQAIWCLKRWHERSVIPPRFMSIRQQRRCNRRRENFQRVREQNLAYLVNNRAAIACGEDFQVTQRMAALWLSDRQKLVNEFPDGTLVEQALQNSLVTRKPHLKSLSQLAEVHCQSQSPAYMQVLKAACLMKIGYGQSFEQIDPLVLQNVRVNLNPRICYADEQAIDNQQIAQLTEVINQQLFEQLNLVEDFLCQYIEPQLASGYRSPDLGLVTTETLSNPTAYPVTALSQLRGRLALRWLKQYPDLALCSLEALFNVAIEWANRAALTNYIEAQLQALKEEPSQDWTKSAIFWFLRGFYFLPLATTCCLIEVLKTDRNFIFNVASIEGGIFRVQNPNWPELTIDKIEWLLNHYGPLWPPVELPIYHGTLSQPKEKAYRFLNDLVWHIVKIDPDEGCMAIGRLLKNPELIHFQDVFFTVRARLTRKATRLLPKPTIQAINDLCHQGAIINVEGLQQFILERLSELQKRISDGAFDTDDLFRQAKDGKHKNENECNKIVADLLDQQLTQFGIEVTIERQYKGSKRADINFSKSYDGKHLLLPIEAKGQWHADLYTTAQQQLTQYTRDPNAQEHGIYLVYWFGAKEKVANKAEHQIKNADQLKEHIEAELSAELLKKIKVVVLDLSG